MMKKDIKDFKEKSAVQLRKEIEKDQFELKKETAEFYGKGDKNPKKIRQLKKGIAQALTILRQKEIEEEVVRQKEPEKKEK